MSNYYKGSISLSPNSLDTICKGILTPNGSTIPDISNNYFKQLGLPIVSATFAVVNDINEKPNNLGYLYNGTDISQYCIAPYVESTGTTFSSIPPWCKNVRAILIGAGGNGGTGEQGNIANHAAVNINIREVQKITADRDRNDFIVKDHTHYYIFSSIHPRIEKADNSTAGRNGDYDLLETFTHGRDHQHRKSKMHQHNIAEYTDQQTGATGGGGGGGAFIYLNSIQVQSGTTLTIEGGSSGQATTLTVQTTKYIAEKGGNAVGTTKGTGGSVQITNKPSNIIIDISGNGKNGDVGTKGASGFSSYSTAFSYGNGGDGGAGSAGANPKVNGTTGTPGQAGYYRIYFLTD